ncbi:MAG: Oligoendopeptidase F, partial [Candidatus Moranbacteria bacterium GW2011_GWD2_38_7]
MKNIENIPSWDLSDLFSSVSDPKIEVIINETSKRAKNFKEKYRDKLAAFSEPSQLLPIIKEYESILSDAIKPQAYAELTFTVDSLSPANGAFLQNIRTKVAEIISELIFFELEITKFSEDVFSRLIDSEMLVDYKHYFERLLVWKPFRLSEAEERVMEMKGLTGRQAFVRLFDQELSRQKFQLTIDGKIVQMTQSEILNILYSNKNQENRAQAAKSFTKGLIQKEDVLTFVMNTLAEDKKIEDSLRGFTFPEQDRHLKNQASPESIEAMCRIVEKFYGLVQQYYVFKKEVLGLEKIFDYDRYAPLKTSGKKYSFEEAREIVLSAFEEFDPRFA